MGFDDIDGEIVSYWDKRSTSYSNGVVGELGDERRDAWCHTLEAHVAAALEAAQAQGRPARVLDLGCGPGFFTALFAKAGCRVDAVDSSPEMLAHARQNVDAVAPHADAAFHECDFTRLPFEADSFDLAVGRNVTWLMRQPEATYAEWLRVLRPEGKLLVFDANWYRYLIDPAVAAARAADMAETAIDGWDEDAQATTDEEKRCEQIASELPMTYVLRPAWDQLILSSLGASSVRVDEEVWRDVWVPSEQSYYGATPLFLVEAVK
jgi:SAM-dependent methyltransferase